MNANPASSGRPSQCCPQPGQAQHPPLSPVSRWHECVDSCRWRTSHAFGSDFSHLSGPVTQPLGSSSASPWSAKAAWEHSTSPSSGTFPAQRGDSGTGGPGVFCLQHQQPLHWDTNNTTSQVTHISGCIVDVAVNANQSLLQVPRPRVRQESIE